MDSLNRQSSSITARLYDKNPDLKYKEIHSYSKIYPDHIKIIRYYRPIVVQNFGNGNAGLANEENSPEKDHLQKSINRTKTRIADYVLCNNFTQFATFTFDPKKVKDRHNFAEMSSLLQNWLNTEQINHKRHHGEKFKYLIVPERHKNGAWHFHALLENYKNETADFYSSKNPYITVKEIKTAKRYKGRRYLTRYTLGRSEVAPIRDKTKMSSYIKKYITKELITEPNAKRYWASRNLALPEIVENIITTLTRVPEKFRTQKHDYHEIYEIPLNDDYAGFLRHIKRVEIALRRAKFKGFWATPLSPKNTF